MNGFFTLLFFTSLLALILGLIKPRIISKLLKKELSRKKIGLLFGIFTIAFLILASLTTDTTSTTKPKIENTQISTPQPTKQTVKEKSYQQIATLSGNGAKQSEPFNILGDRFKVKYDVTGNPCYIQVRPTKESYKSITVVNVEKPTKDETIVNKKGEYYLDVIVCDSFNLIVEDFK